MSNLTPPARPGQRPDWTRVPRVTRGELESAAAPGLYLVVDDDGVLVDDVADELYDVTTNEIHPDVPVVQAARVLDVVLEHMDPHYRTAIEAQEHVRRFDHRLVVFQWIRRTDVLPEPEP